MIQCQWKMGTQKRQIQCPCPAAFVGPTQVFNQKHWHLCKDHKDTLLNAYNEETKKSQGLLWKPL